MNCTTDPVLHILVAGFHHKRGCQIEYSYPEISNADNECPLLWKYLPTLALPDGSHNYNEDTAYFHLPSLTNSNETIYGISCFKQIPVEKIKNLTEDITRNTVQKAVCVLSRVPLYGYIQVKMELITQAYFDNGDFSNVSIIKDTYHHLNSCLTQTQISTHMFHDLSAKDFILNWRHKAVLLFKLILLEKRVLFYHSPVRALSSTILTLLSLHPGMIEQGLKESACIESAKSLPQTPISDENLSIVNNDPTEKNIDQCIATKEEYNKENTIDENDTNLLNKENNQINEDLNNKLDISTESINQIKISDDINSVENAYEDKSMLFQSINKDPIIDTTLSKIAQINAEACGLPLSVFTNGNLCMPYFSLPYMDLLSNTRVKGYVIGATNILFKQKRQLADVVVEIESGNIEAQDNDLKRQLHLTTEDLRFADYLVKHVSEEKYDTFLNGVDWEGGDEWVRTQFKIYMLCLLRTSLLENGSRELDPFNSSFISAWKKTNNYKIWLRSEHNEVQEVQSSHPFAGQLSVADMKLRFAHTMQNTESGRKLNQAMMSTGKAVTTTSRAVGGVLSQAKGVFSNWWSNLTTVGLEMDPSSVLEPNEVVEESNIKNEEQEMHDSKNIDPYLDYSGDDKEIKII